MHQFRKGFQFQEIPGHEDRETTTIYLQNADGAAHQAMAIYEEARKSHTEVT